MNAKYPFDNPLVTSPDAILPIITGESWLLATLTHCNEEGIEVGKLLRGLTLVSRYFKLAGRVGDNHAFKFGHALNDIVTKLSGIVNGV